MFRLSPSSIFAPILFKQLMRSMTSGSSAIFVISLSPLASEAAITIFSVAPTETLSKFILFPIKPFGALHFMYPLSNSNDAPSFVRALICKSTGLAPIAHPPGSETLACLLRARSGPRTKMLALIFLTKSYSAITLSESE